MITLPLSKVKIKQENIKLQKQNDPSVNPVHRTK